MPFTPVPEYALSFTPATTKEEAAQQVAAVIAIVNDELRAETAANLEKVITPENLRAYYDGWRQVAGRGPTPPAENTRFNTLWGRLIGPEVVGQRDGNGPRDMMGAYSFVRDQLHGWMETNSAAARTWIDGLQHEEFRAAMEAAWEQKANPGGQ